MRFFSADLLPYPLSGGGLSIMTSSLSSDSKLIVITSSAGDH